MYSPRAKERQYIYGLVSLFTGLGWLERGLIELGSRVAVYVEQQGPLRKFYKDWYRRHCRESPLTPPSSDPVELCSSEEVQPLDLLQRLKVVGNLLCGGFPCKDVSVAGPQDGDAAERTGAWYDVMNWLQVNPHSEYECAPHPVTTHQSITDPRLCFSFLCSLESTMSCWRTSPDFSDARM